MSAVYGFSQKKDAETLRDMARAARPGASTLGRRGIDSGSRTFVCVPDEDVPPAQTTSSGTILPGSVMVTVYLMKDDGTLTERLDEYGDPLKLQAFNLANSTIERVGSNGKFHLVSEDAFGRLFFFRSSAATQEFVRPSGPIYSWLADEDDPDRDLPILADAPVSFSYYLNGGAVLPAEKESRLFKAAALDAYGSLWRWVKNSDLWYVSQTLPNGKQYAFRDNELTSLADVFGGTFYRSGARYLYPRFLESNLLWVDSELSFNLFTYEKLLDSNGIFDGYALAWTLNPPFSIQPLEDGATLTATPTEAYRNVFASASTFELTYSRTVYPIENGEWKDENGSAFLFGVPVWTIGDETFKLAPVDDGATYRLEGAVTVGETVYSNLTWNSSRESWILGTLNSPDGWYEAPRSSLSVADGWKFSASLEFQQAADSAPESRDALTLSFSETLEDEAFSGTALILHPERLSN